MVGAFWSFFAGEVSNEPLSVSGETWSTGDIGVDAVPDSRRDDDSDASLFLAVPMAIVDALLVGNV
jgi:hypothetical protein